MENKIRSLSQLQIEIDRLSIEKKLQENQIRDNFKDLQERLKPINLIKNTFSSITGSAELKDSIKSKGAEAAIGFLVSQLLFKKSNALIKTVATILGTSVASSIFGDDSSDFVSKIKKLIHKFRRKVKVQDDDLFSEANNYKA